MMDGYAACRAFRRHDHFKDALIVAQPSWPGKVAAMSIRLMPRSSVVFETLSGRILTYQRVQAGRPSLYRPFLIHSSRARQNRYISILLSIPYRPPGGLHYQIGHAAMTHCRHADGAANGIHDFRPCPMSESERYGAAPSGAAFPGGLKLDKQHIAVPRGTQPSRAEATRTIGISPDRLDSASSRAIN